jgi:SAM-dependent methyltransferase
MIGMPTSDCTAIPGSARSLAEAMRAGLESRWLVPSSPVCQDFPAGLRGDTRRQLHHYGDLLNHPATAKPGRFAPVIRLFRKVLRTLLRPWLELQSRCNAGLIEALETIHLAAFARFAALNSQLEDRCQMLHDLVSKKTTSHTPLYEYQGPLEPPMEGYTDEDLNRELGNRGKLARAGLWFNPPVVVRFDKNEAHSIGISERILEHMFVHTRLPKPPAQVLDLGCSESVSALEMASFGFDVTGVDLRDLPLEHPSFRMVRADIAQLPFDAANFDVVVSLSTIEHVGLDWYGAEQKGTDMHVAAEVQRVLRPGGLFLLTVPYGRAALTPLHRVYDRARLDELLRCFERVETMYGVRDGNCWTLTPDAAVADAADSTDRVSAVALVVARKA